MNNKVPSFNKDFRKSIEQHIRKQEKDVTKAPYPCIDNIYSDVRRDTSFFLDKKNTDDFLDVAFKATNPLIDKDTFYIGDISNHRSNYNSLIFQLDGSCIKTKENSTKIIDRFATHHHLSYERIRTIGQMIGIKQKCPYILGNFYFAPDRGTTKNNANWLALHHVIYYESFPEFSYFIFRDNHELSLPLTKKAVENIVERACVLCQLDEIILHKLMQTHQSFANKDFPNNIVQQHLHFYKLNQQLPSYYDIFDQIAFTEATKIAASLLGETHLTIDEIQKVYPNWFGIE